MTHSQCFLALVIGALLAGTDVIASDNADAPAQPNIVVYMIEGLGWNQISAGQGTMDTHSGVFQTPHLEQLANEGLSFNQAYMQPNCAPSRAAILSGQYPARVNKDVYVVGNLNRNEAPGIARMRHPRCW